METKFSVVYRKKEKETGANFWPRIGHAFDAGEKISIRIDSLPRDSEWDGWLYLFEVIEKDNTKTKNKKRQRKVSQRQPHEEDVEF